MDNNASAASPQAPDDWPPPSLQRVLRELGHRRIASARLISREEIARSSAGPSPEVITAWHVDGMLQELGQMQRRLVEIEKVSPQDFQSGLGGYGGLRLKIDVYALSPGELKTALRAAYDAGRDDAGPASSSALLAVLREQINTQQLLPPFEP
jgi:hypothetical protein